MTAFIIDVETTGRKNSQVIELGWVTFNWKESSSNFIFERRYKPNIPIEYGAMATHHILLEDLENCPDSNTVYYDLPDKIDYWIGHNCDFDYEALGKPSNVKLIDTLAISRKLYPELDSHTQSAMLYFFEGVGARDKLVNAHSALTDCKNCADLLRHLIQVINSRGNLPRVENLEELYNFSQSCRLFDVMPFGKYKGEPLAKIPMEYISWLKKQPDVDFWLVESFKSIGKWWFLIRKCWFI